MRCSNFSVTFVVGLRSLFFEPLSACSRWFRDFDSRGQCVCQVRVGGAMFSVAHQENQGTSAMRLRHDVGTRFNKGFACCAVGSLVGWLVVLVFGDGWCRLCEMSCRLARGACHLARRGACVSHQPHKIMSFMTHQCK